MGSTESKYDIPIPILTFGPGTLSESQLLRLKGQAAGVNKFIMNADRLIKLGTLLGSKAIKTTGKYSGPLAIAITLLAQLLEDTDKLNRAMNNLETRLFSTILDGKLRALKSAQGVISDPTTSDSQLVAELVYSVHQFEEILPIFTNKDSILYKYYFLGAPLFVQICSMFQLIIAFAEGSAAAGYINSNIHELKREYSETLRLYKQRCIRQRLRSCNVYVNAMQGGAYSLYFAKDLVNFPYYFTTNNCTPSRTIWSLIRDDEGFEDHILHCAAFKGPGRHIYDAWDHRSTEHLPVNTIVLEDDKTALQTYRQMVKDLMEKFFDEICIS